MNRTETLQFIRKNSRLVVSVNTNGTTDRFNDDEKSIFEQRIGNNGRIFILHDFGAHGWDLYFTVGGNELTTTIQEFCVRTGCDVPALRDQVS